jgi:hypothetical protein
MGNGDRSPHCGVQELEDCCKNLNAILIIIERLFVIYTKQIETCVLHITP